MGDEQQVTTLVTEGSTLYYATLYLGEDLKHRVHLLHSLHDKISSIPLNCSDPGVARVKLEWWREETRRIRAGTARHPLGKQMQSLMPDTGFDTDTLIDMIATAEDRISPAEITSIEELRVYLDRGPGLPWRITSSICGSQDPETGNYADSIIRNSVWLELLQEIYPLGQKGHCLIPREKLDAHGLDRQTVINNPAGIEVKTMLRGEYEDVSRQLRSALEGLPGSDRNAQLVLLILGRLSLALCRELLKSPLPDPESRIALTPLRRLWISWWTRIFER